jgi:hypothetical protein
MAEAQRPTVATVFAILHFIFGAIGLIGGLIAVAGASALASFLGAKFMIYFIPTILSLLVSALLIFAGITLIGNKKNAIQINLIYAISSAALAVLNAVIQAVVLSALGPMFGVSWFGLIIGLIYPALVFFLIVRNAEVKKFYA